jgi:protein arginine N-methyltransferase 7
MNMNHMKIYQRILFMFIVVNILELSFAYAAFHASPGPDDWCDHWKQCVWVVPGSGISILKGGEINLHATHNDTSISYNLDTQVSTTEVLHQGLTPGDFQLVLPPERAAIYGDKDWRLSMLKAVESAVSYSSLHLMKAFDVKG